MKKKFIVTGMFCAACVAHVDKAVSKIEGVNHVNVALLSNSMIVDYDDTKTNDFNIINAVKKVGFNAYVEDNRLVTNSSVKKRKIGLIISIILMLLLMYVAMGPMLSLPILNILKNNIVVNGIVQIVLLIPIIIINRLFYTDGFKKLIKRAPNMNSLIFVASFSAILYGIFNLIYYVINSQNISHSHIDLYFESAGTIVTLVSLGKYIEHKSKAKTTEAVNEMLKLVPQKSIKITEKNGTFLEEEVFVEEIKIDDILLIKNASSVPVDGVIIEGGSELNESSITGESLPVYKQVGDSVIASSIATVGSFKMKATSTISDSTISKIINIVEEASSSKAPISRLADKISFIFVPSVMLISFLSFVLWMIFDGDLEFAFRIMISVLVISCPCALGLATPLAIMIASGKGAKHGVLFKDAESIEMLYKSDVVCLDKTGTITSGNLKLNNIINVNSNYKDGLKIAASLEKNSTHPIASAIINSYDNMEYYEVSDFKLVVGKGVEGIINNKKYYIGNVKFIKEKFNFYNQYIDLINEEEEKGNTVLLLSSEKEIISIMSVSDDIKEDSFKAIENLKKLGKKVIIMTGDSKIVSERIGKRLNVDSIYSELLPDEKGKIINELKKDGHIVTMVGDGINDAIALTNSDIGIAIGAGTDVAISSANIILVKNNLEDIVYSISLSKHTINNIKISLFWAFIYNSLCIPIACGILYPFIGLSLNPMIAAVAMSLSSISVVLNALRLRKNN